MRYLSTISSAKVSAFLNSLEQYGANCEQILAASGISPVILQSPDQRISSVELKIIMEEAVRATNNDDIGLLQGESISRGFSNILGYVLLNCSTLGEAAEKYCKYEKIVDGTSVTELRIDGDLSIISSATADDMLAGVRQFSDFKLSGIVTYTKLLTGKKVMPSEVHLSYKRPLNSTVHERVFGCPVHFGSKCDMLAFNRKDFDMPVIMPNRNLLSMFEEMALRTLEELGLRGIYTERVADSVLKEMRGSMPTIDRISALLSMSTRNLQMCLKKEETTYTRLVNDIRKRTAFSYLSGGNIPVDEIAFVLGFSESSAFHRAFKRWTNMTPGEFRCKSPEMKR